MEDTWVIKDETDNLNKHLLDYRRIQKENEVLHFSLLNATAHIKELQEKIRVQGIALDTMRASIKGLIDIF